MGRRTKWTFFQRGNADSQQAHEKMLNITNHQENANQNHNEIPPHTRQNDYHQKEDHGGGLWLSLESPQGIRSSLHLVR